MKVSMSLKEALYIGWLCDGCPTNTKAVQIAQCRSRGIPVPEDLGFGRLVIVKNLFQCFNGRTFYPLLEETGHDHIGFEGCCCNKE
jgi:hypothetical protein